ncbi:DegT/DnrJ/EryC1/StrS aminotransferase-like protein [Aureococcus anophagefferens]|nr:DegT/DnrJ/EryC1/StrS aminotransferase-like protein [Aureococcus anophagefferens]
MIDGTKRYSVTTAMAQKSTPDAAASSMISAPGLIIVPRVAGRRFAPGAEVLLPSFTFAATARAALRAGLTPVFCDVDEASHFISIASAERATTPKTVAVVGVHLWGRAGDAAALEAFAARRSLDVFYDSAHAFGAAYADGAKVGTRGRAEVFSLHATKLLNGFEGGLIATNDDALAVAATRARNFGFSGQDTIVSMGTNAKLSEVHAALALRHLRVVDATLDAYRAVAASRRRSAPRAC